jgi:L-cysteine desulfidase
VSGNILKNGMGVGIPGTGRVGLPVAAALGAVCGDSRRNLEVLADVTDVAVKRALELVEGQKVSISVADTDHLLYVKATVCANGQAQASAEVNPQAYAIIEDDHDRIVETCFADRILMSSESAAGLSGPDEGEDTPSVREILDFANNAPFADIAFILEDRTLNLALAREGLAGNYGMNVGKTIR